MEGHLGLFDEQWARLINRVALGLVHLTPEYWQRIHCLIRTRGEDGRGIAKYVVRYADLTTCDIDIAYGADMVEWWASVA
jgi:hypothetical protein